MFESLTKHLPAIENAEGFGNWVVDRESKGTMNDPIKMPYVNYGTTERRFLTLNRQSTTSSTSIQSTSSRITTTYLNATDSSGAAKQCLGQMYRNLTARR